MIEFTFPATCSYSEKNNPVYVTIFYSFKLHFNIFLPSDSTYSKRFYLRVFLLNYCRYSHLCHILRPSHSLTLDPVIIFAVSKNHAALQVTILRSLPCHFVPLSSKYLPPSSTSVLPSLRQTKIPPNAIPHVLIFLYILMSRRKLRNIFTYSVAHYC